MDRRRAAGALLALAACIACATAAPTASNQTALDLYDAGSTEGCYYNFQHYGEGDRIMTNEPCLNCTCHNRMLMCYLRVCPFTKPIGQDCTVEKRADQCCPIVTCPDVPVDLLTSTPTTSPAEYGTTGVGRLDKYGCTINGKYFPEGSKVPQSPNKPCEHCYCIRNMTTCVMQECTLHVDGCTPIYYKEVCCPIRYSCDHPDDEVPMLDDMTTTVRPTPGFLLTTTTVASVTQIPQECVHEDQIFADGALIKTEKACEHCYCMKGDIVCVVQECGTPMENEGKNCTSLAPREGQCCPDTYICEGDEVPTELPTEVPTEEPKEEITEITTEQATEGQEEQTTKVTTEVATQKPKESSVEEPEEVSTQVPIEDISDAQKEKVTKVPPEMTTEISTQDVTEEQNEVTTDLAIKEVMEVLRESSTETTTKDTTEVQKEAQTENPQEETTLMASEEVTEQQKESITDTPKETETEVPTDAATEAQKEVTTETPKETVMDTAIDVISQTEGEPATETSTEGSGEAATERASDATTELSTQDTKLPSTEEATHGPSDLATEEITNAVSEISPDEPIEELTTFIPPRRTSVEGSGYRNEPDELFTESPFQETEGSGYEEKTERPSYDESTSIPIEEITSPVRDVASEITTAKELSSTEPTISYTEQSTTEPDKGENTVPSDDALPSISELITTEASEAIQPSEETTLPVESAIPSEDRVGELPSATTPESITTENTENAISTTVSVLGEEKSTETPTESTKIKESEIITTEKSSALETVSPTTSFDEKEPKSTTAQLSDTPSTGLTIKQQQTTTEIVQEYTTTAIDNMDQNLFTTVQAEVEETKATTLTGEMSETTSINPLENEIHEDTTPHLTPGIIPGEGNCLVDGITYNNDSVVPTSHKCQASCKCMSSIVKCEEIMCSPQPENMGYCQAVYESEETCCPYYTCDQGKETPPLKPHSQMSATELPTTQSDCDGETCIKLDEEKPDQAAPQCMSSDCTSETDIKNEELCGETGCADQQAPISIPTKEDDAIHPEICSDGKCVTPPKDCIGDSCTPPTRKDCGKDGNCDVSPQETCEGPKCGIDVTPVTESAQDGAQDCANPEDCKSSPSVSSEPTCLGEECTLVKQDCSSGKCENIPVEISSTPTIQQQEDCSSGKCESIPVEVPSISSIQKQPDCSTGECESIPAEVPSTLATPQQEDCTSGKCEGIPVEVSSIPAIQPEEDCSSGKCDRIPVQVPSTPAIPQQEDCIAGKCEGIPVEVPSIPTIQPQEDCSSGKCENIPVEVPSTPGIPQQDDCSSGKCESIPVEITSTTATERQEDCSSGKCESIPVPIPSTPAVQQQEDCSSGKCEGIPFEVSIPVTPQQEDCSSGKCEGIPTEVPSTPGVQQQEDCSSGKCENIPVEGPSMPATQQHEDCSSGKCESIPVAVSSIPTIQQQEDCSSGKCEGTPVEVTSISSIPKEADCSTGKCDSIPVEVPSTPATPQQEDCSSGKCEGIPIEVSSSTPVIQPQEDCSSGKCESIPVEVPDIPDIQEQEACNDENDCKKPDQSQEPQLECTDEACIKKQITDIKQQSSPTCTGNLCVQQQSTPQISQVEQLSTELPESVDKLQTELPPAIDTESDKEITSGIAVTEPEDIATTAQTATPSQEITTEASEPTTAAQQTVYQGLEITDTEPQNITPEIDQSNKVQEVAPTTETSITEPQENKQPATELPITKLPDSVATEKSQTEPATVVMESEEEKPEGVTHRQDIVTELPIGTTPPEAITETEPYLDSDVTQSSLVTEGDEVRTEVPEALPTQLPAVTESSEKPIVTESQEIEQSMAEEPVSTEGPQESPVTETQSYIVTSEDDRKTTEINKIPDDQLDITKSPESVTEIPELETTAETEQPVQEGQATEQPDIYTTTIQLIDEQVINTESPNEYITELPVVPIVDDKDNTESPMDVTTAASELPASQDEAINTEMLDSYTTEINDMHTKKPEIPPSEEQVKQTVASEAPVIEILEEHTTPSVYSITEIQGVSDGLREGAITDKEFSPTDSSTSTPPLPSKEEENIPEQPATETPQEKTTLQSESTVTDKEEIETKLPEIHDDVTYVTTPADTELDNVVTNEPETPAMEEGEKLTEVPITDFVETQTKFPEIPTEQGTSIKETVEPQETVTSSSDHQEKEDERATEPTILPQDARKPDVGTEIPEISNTEPQKSSTDFPAISIPQEEQTEIPEEHTESQQVQMQDEVARITTETQEFVTKAPEYTTELPEATEQPIDYMGKTETPSNEKSTEVPEISSKTPEEQHVKTDRPLATATESQEINTTPIVHTDSELDEFVTKPQETVTDIVESVTQTEEKLTEIPETSATEPQGVISTTQASQQDVRTDAPEVGNNQDTALPEVTQPEESAQTKTPEYPFTELQEMATKVPVTDYSSDQGVTSEPLPTEIQAATETSVTTTKSDISSEVPESPVTEPQEASTERLETSIPEEPESQTSAPEVSTGVPNVSVQEDIGRPTMVSESHVTDSPQISTKAPEQQDISTLSPISPDAEQEEAFTNVPTTIVPGEQSTLPPAVQTEESATNAPEVPIQEEKTVSPIEQEQEPAVTGEPSITEHQVTEILAKTTTEPQHIITDSPLSDVDFTVTEVPELDERISSSEAPVTETSPPKLEYSETTPYLVELEEHTHKIEVETTTVVLDGVSTPQTAEEYEKSEEPSEKQTQAPSVTEKTVDVSNMEPITNAPTTIQEATTTELGPLSTLPEEQSTSKSEVDDTRRTTISSEEVEDKIQEPVPVPVLPFTVKEVEATASPEHETEKYTTAQPTEKPVETTSSQEVSSEEDAIPSRTTTFKSTDEATTFAPSNKATTLEPKPTELPSPISQETAKPTSSEEVAPEEDAGQFPPSGTGYGQEPDYAEEDQAFGPGTCRYGGKVYVSAQQIPRDDPCDFCFCFRSDIICLQQSCPPPIHGCHEEPIQGFCCPRYECPVSMATTLNVTTTTTTTTTTLPPHFLTHAYNGAAQKRGCLIKGHTYKVGEVVRASSGPCLHCTCGGDGQMKCDPKVCTPEPMLRQMIAAAVSAKRRR